MIVDLYRSGNKYGVNKHMTDDQFFWYMVVQIALALGTIALAVMALWGHTIRMKLYGPKLKIELKNIKGTQSQFPDGVMSYYYHLRVKNENRISSAHNVRVVVKDLRRFDVNGNMKSESPSGPLQLVWQLQRYKPQYQTIGAESICDLGFIRKGENFQLSTLYRPISFDNSLLSNQKMLVVLVAQSDEVESNELRLEISWNGKWSEELDAMSKNLIIKTV